MVLTDRKLTADEYFALPPDGRRIELIDGELVQTDPKWRHQRIAFQLAHLIAKWLEEHPGRGATGMGWNYRMDEHNVFIPDVWFLSAEQVPIGDPLWHDGPPDLVAEVRSPSTWRYDIGRKKDLYLELGAKELWLVDTAADVVLVFRGEESLEVGRGETLTTPLLPGFAIDLTSLFDR